MVELFFERMRFDPDEGVLVARVKSAHGHEVEVRALTLEGLKLATRYALGGGQPTGYAEPACRCGEACGS